MPELLEPMMDCDRTSPYQRILEEFRASAIPDRLTHANVQWIEGDWAVEAMAEVAIAKCQRVTSYVTVPAARILKSCEYAADGGWISYGCDLQGKRGDVAYFKPFNPPKELKNGKLKSIKYPTPQGAEALPVMPWVDPETAHEIYQRYGVTPLEGELFWQVVWRCNIPVAICEGLKKALSLIGHGIPAIALRGVGCWHKKGSSELHEALAHFATPKRTIYLVFDQDEKASTQRDVRIQLIKLGNVLEDIGCKIQIPIWDRKLGKGIDDALHGKGEETQAWLDELLDDALSLKDCKREGARAAAWAMIQRSKKLSYPVERETTGEYLPELPPIEQGKIHILSAEMGAGKTTRISTDWVKGAIAQGYNVLILPPLNSLGRQTAKDVDLPHIHDFGTSPDAQQALWSMVSASRGVVMCPDSLPRLPDWFFQRPVLLILDEANQVIEHISEGNTLGSRWSAVLERFTAIVNTAIESGAIVLSEANLPDRAVRFIQKITDTDDDRVRVFLHRKQSVPWPCTAYSKGASGFRAMLLERVQSKRILYPTSSQREGKRLERAIAKRSPHLKVFRIDSQTNQQGTFNQFFDAPDTWIQENQPDVLILSPSVKSGVSIEGGVMAEDAYFAEVWGYFPALATDTHLQLLGRYRPPVPRHFFAPNFISASGDESLYNPRAIQRRLQQNLKIMARVHGLDELLSAEGERAEILARIEEAVGDYLAESKAISGAQKSLARDALIHRLEQSGHVVTEEELNKDQATTDLWKEVQEEVWREDAEAIASATVEERHTPEWAHKTLDSMDVALETRILAQKILWREEFPGVLFDDSEECYQALCQDYGMMRRGVRLQASAENLEATKAGDRSATESILSSGVRALHKLPRNYARSWLLAKIGLLELLDGREYSNSDPRAIAIKKAALFYAKDINYYLRLNIKKDQTPVEICNKLLKKFGLELDKPDRPGALRRTRREGARGEQDWIYLIDLSYSPTRARLLEAARRKLSKTGSHDLIIKELPNQIVTTPPKKNPGLVGWGTSLSPWIVEEVQGDRAKIRNSLSGYATSAPLSELREAG